MARFELADIEGYTINDVTTPEDLKVLNRHIAEYQQQRVIDGEGEALAPSSVLLGGAGIELNYSGVEG